MSWFPALVAIAVVAMLLLSTPAGRSWRARMTGSSGRAGGAAAPREDHDYLLRACGGDEEELTRRLEAELRRNPHQSEAELYRRAIRRILRPER